MKKDIDGKKFGEKLLNLASGIRLSDILSSFSYNPSRTQIERYRDILNQLQDNKVLKKQWEELWRWRTISKKHDKILHFQYQCLLRNPNIQYIEHPQLIKELQPEGWYKLCLKVPIAVTEIFNCLKENQKTVLHRDLEVVKTDKDYHVPVIYLRVDLRRSKKDIEEKIEDLIDKKKKDYEIKKIGEVSKTMEIALMIHDLKNLKDLKLSAEDIQRFIKWTVDDTCRKGYVKEKLAYAKKLIEQSSERNFPPKTKK